MTSQPRRTPALLLTSLLLALQAGCPAPPTALAMGQQVAQEFNQDARFGRTELTSEHVAPAAREEFAAHHRAWGSGVRIADLEMAGMHAQGDHELYVTVRVSWYRPDEQELRTTTVQQAWKDDGGWKLTSEKRIEGDFGLLGESVVYEKPEVSSPKQFPTVRLGTAGTERAVPAPSP